MPRAKKAALRDNWGSTIVELVIVIILVGILVAVALPRLIGTSREARIAGLESLRASLLSGANLANVQCRFTNGCFKSGWATATVTSPDGNAGRMYNGYPTANASIFASHITRWVKVSGFSVDTNSVLFTDFLTGGIASPNECKLRYNYAQSFGEEPSIVLTTSGC